MQSPLIRLQNAAAKGRLSFAPEVERAFQESYYSRIRGALRFSLFFMAGVSILSVMMPLTQHMTGGNWAAFLVVAIVNLVLLGWSLHRSFSYLWQPLVVATTWIFTIAALFETGENAITGVSIYLMFVWFRIQRLHLRWMTIQSAGLLLIGAVALLLRTSFGWGKLLGESGVALFTMAIPLFFTLKNERFERGEFWTKYSLAEERNDERHKREHTEKMLHILSQAIGGIVHDLGNPLTSVQSGADTLLMFVKNGDADPETVQEFAEIILDGAQMLNYLRLSLMEQTRVLEGKPVPVNLQPTSLSHIIKAGAQYQKPKFSAGRSVCFHGEELQVMADEMRLVTVFMNLIGNALKYSDGEVRIGWRTHENQVLIAVLDRGREEKGISQAQAEGLFVAFGRLDIHAQVEGTGLGLLSVRKIVEAHGGEVYIEGRSDGIDSSAGFCTARGSYPDMLEEGFLTAFVAACPLKIVPQEVEPQAAIFQTPVAAPDELVCFSD